MKEGVNTGWQTMNETGQRAGLQNVRKQGGANNEEVKGKRMAANRNYKRQWTVVGDEDERVRRLAANCNCDSCLTSQAARTTRGLTIHNASKHSGLGIHAGFHIVIVHIFSRDITVTGFYLLTSQCCCGLSPC